MNRFIEIILQKALYILSDIIVNKIDEHIKYLIVN